MTLAIRVAGALWLLPALAAPAPAAAEAAVGLAEAARSVGLDPAQTVDPFRVSDEMRQWAHSRVPESLPERDRLVALLRALKHSEDLGLEYRDGYTGTPEEVFETGAYNCLSFSILFVSLARELGLEAYFLSVRGVEEYKRSGDLVILTGHVTAGYGALAERTVLEFDVGPAINYRTARTIGDRQAAALFFSNRGAELLRRDDPAAAIDQLELALALEGELLEAWVNLGVARRRAGDAAGAKAAYRKAIELEDSNPSAYHNLAALLRLEGDRDAVGEILSILERAKSRNPYTALDLGDSSLRAGRVDDAERYYRRAFRLARHEAETHAAMGQWALAAGRRTKARQWLDEALEIDPQNERAVRLRRRLESLRP